MATGDRVMANGDVVNGNGTELSAGYRGIGILIRGARIIPVLSIVAFTILAVYGLYTWRAAAAETHNVTVELQAIREHLRSHTALDGERLLVFRIICHAVTSGKELNKMCPAILTEESRDH